jgi:hypothetical protein
MELNSMSSFHRKPANSMRFAIFLIGAAAVVLIVWLGYNSFASQAEPPLLSDYQAVFLENGQVYFGKLKPMGSWLALTDVYYLQVTQPLQSASGQESPPTQTGTANASQEVKLVKLGSELHGPQDAMYIDRSKILFWENMKEDSKVLEAIKRYGGN